MSHQKCPKKAALIRHHSYHKLKISIPLLGCDLTSTSGNSVCVCVGGGGGQGKLCLHGDIRWNISSETPQGGGSNKKSQLPHTQKINTPLGLWSNKHWQQQYACVCICGGDCLSKETYAGMSYQKRLREAALIRHHSYQKT